MNAEREHLQQAIDALQAQRAVLGDATVDVALAPLRERLAALTATLPPELKYVSILFLDVVGSTSLSERLDPEDVQAIMDRALHRFAATIEAHGGTVLNFAGDAVLAVFGAQTTHEDDTERAVTAALALLQVGQAEGQRVRERFAGADFGVRVGVHSGEVLVGGAAEVSNSIRGYHVNVAARMEQSAPPGGLRISHDTYRHVRERFEVVEQPPIQVKGVSGSVRSYLVQGLCAPRFRVPGRGLDGISTPLTGRTAELQTLGNALRQVIDTGAFAEFDVLGPVGVGKSRLLLELEHEARRICPGLVVLKGRARSGARQQHYGLLREVLMWQVGKGTGDAATATKSYFEPTLMALFAALPQPQWAESHVHILGHLVGLDYADSPHVRAIAADTTQMRQRGYHAAVLAFELLAQRQGAPLLVLLEDLHGADAASLDFLQHFAGKRPQRVLLVTAARVPWRDRQPEPAGGDTCTRLDLAPLSASAAAQLAQSLLQHMAEVPPILLDYLVRSAQGNPYFMEELVRMLCDEGLIVTAATGWHLRSGDLPLLRVPPTLAGVLQARVDRLQNSVRRHLQCCSVVGPVFWDAAVAALEPEATQSLPQLLQPDLLEHHQPSSLPGYQEYGFVHPLLHQVCYGALPRRQRAALHARLAAWMEAHALADCPGLLVATAEQHERSDAQGAAARVWAEAARHAAARYADSAALACSERGLAALARAAGDSDPTDAGLLSVQWTLLSVRERIFDLRGERPAQRAVLEQLRQCAEASADPTRQAEVAWRDSNLAMRTGDFATMRHAAEKALQWAQAGHDERLALLAGQRLALALAYLGEPRAGAERARSGLERARALGLTELVALYLNALSVICDSEAELPTSLGYDEEALALNRMLGNRRHEAMALSNLGHGWLRLGDPARALPYLEEGLNLSRAIGDRATEPHRLAALSVLARHQQRWHDAARLAQEAVARAVAVGSPDFEAISLCALGHAHLGQQQHAAAKAAFDRALHLATELGEPSALDAQAGLVATAMLADDRVALAALVETLHQQLGDTEALATCEAPGLAQRIAVQALLALADGRARPLLHRACARLRTLAQALPTAELAQGYLQAIPEHRELLALFDGQGGADTPQPSQGSAIAPGGSDAA